MFPDVTMKKVLTDIFRVCSRELHLVFKDEGVLIFFFLLCAIYPVLYSIIYNPEVVRDEPMVVVDDCRTQFSRDFVRRLDATQGVRVVGYAASMQEAREAFSQKRAYAVLYIDRDFSADVVRNGKQGHVSLYCDMSVMMRYKAFLTALSDVQQEVGNELHAHTIEPFISQKGSIIKSRQVPVGNTAMGIASAVLLFILPLVLQQSMLLGIGMLHGGSIERRRKNGGVDPMAIEAGTMATVLGKTLCHLVIYVLPTIYVLHYVPMMFGFPQHANVWHELIIAVPFLIACSFMGQTLQAVVNERESVFLLFVFSSVVFVFLVGASWPRYLLSTKWHAVANCVPSTWMCNAYVLMQSGGAQLHHVAHYWRMLWLLCAVLFAFAYCVERFVNRRRYRIWQERSAARPDALLRYDLIKNGIN